MAPPAVLELRTGSRCGAEATARSVRARALAGHGHRKPRRIDQASFPPNGHRSTLGQSAAIADRATLFQRAHLRAPPRGARRVLLLELAVAPVEPAVARPAARFDLCLCRFHLSTPARIGRIARGRGSESGPRTVRLRSTVCS